MSGFILFVCSRTQYYRNGRFLGTKKKTISFLFSSLDYKQNDDGSRKSAAFALDPLKGIRPKNHALTFTKVKLILMPFT